MGRFKEQLRAGRIHLISLEVRGPRSREAQRAFIEALVALSKQHKVKIHGLERERGTAARKSGARSASKRRGRPKKS